MTLDTAPILTPLTGGLLQPAYPLTSEELGRLLAALRCARSCGVDADAFSELAPDEQALLLRLGIKARTGPTTMEEPKAAPEASVADIKVKTADIDGILVVGANGTAAAVPLEPESPKPRPAASF